MLNMIKKVNVALTLLSILTARGGGSMAGAV
jgi:hypothetical protein